MLQNMIISEEIEDVKMNATVTFMHERGRLLSEEQRLRRPVFAGKLTVVGLDSPERGRVVTVARVTTHRDTAAGSTVQIHDAAMVWLIDDSFSLSGTEVVNGVPYSQVWVVEAKSLSARAAKRQRRPGYQRLPLFSAEYLLSHFNIEDHLPSPAKGGTQLRLLRTMPRGD